MDIACNNRTSMAQHHPMFDGVAVFHTRRSSARQSKGNGLEHTRGADWESRGTRGDTFSLPAGSLVVLHGVGCGAFVGYHRVCAMKLDERHDST